MWFLCSVPMTMGDMAVVFAGESVEQPTAAFAAAPVAVWWHMPAPWAFRIRRGVKRGSAWFAAFEGPRPRSWVSCLETTARPALRLSAPAQCSAAPVGPPDLEILLDSCLRL